MNRSDKILLYGSLTSIIYIIICLYIHRDRFINIKELESRSDTTIVEDVNISYTPSPDINNVENYIKMDKCIDIDYVREMISDILSRNRISFYSGSSRMTEESKESLNDIIKYINSLTGDKEIIISGYTDASGSRAKNRELSLMRAKAVERYLRLNGLIKPYKIETIGYGEDNLIDDKNPYSPINRRVDIDIRR